MNGKWFIECTTKQNGKVIKQEIWTGINRHGDGPDKKICHVVSGCAGHANLIAAAPELLEALQVIADHNELYYGESHNTVIMARAAIKKALGEWYDTQPRTTGRIYSVVEI